MLDLPTWEETETKVHRPALWLPLLLGTVFVVIGGFGFLTYDGEIPPDMPDSTAKFFFGTFILFGAVGLAWAIGGICWPVHVRHAAPDVLPDVPKGPVIREGSVVSGLAHELCETAEGWEFRPTENLWRNTKRFLLGYGIPFLILFSGLLAWVFHGQLKIADWPLSVVFATIVTAVCGGSCFLLIGMMMRSSYRRLPKLTIPDNGSDLELESEEEPNWESEDLTEALRWVFLGGTKRQQLTIPRGCVVAVQICPWNYAVGRSAGRSTTWAVQGLLVLADPEKAAYLRLPLLLSCDFSGAARLMQRLARTLHVPYLFCADSAGWKAEAIRAKSRPPLRVGGM